MPDRAPWRCSSWATNGPIWSENGKRHPGRGAFFISRGAGVRHRRKCGSVSALFSGPGHAGDAENSGHGVDTHARVEGLGAALSAVGLGVGGGVVVVLAAGGGGGVRRRSRCGRGIKDILVPYYRKVIAGHVVILILIVSAQQLGPAI